MPSANRPTRNLVSVITFGFVFLTFLVIIPDTFAQTPNLTKAAALISIPGEPVSRPRRVEPENRTPDAAAIELTEPTEIEKRAFEATNAARVQNGLPLLTWDAELCRMARAHSEKMVRLGFFSHQTPDGAQLKDRAHAAGILHFKMFGENIAYNQGFDDPGGFAVSRWMLSPGHRANILNSSFTQSAIGVFTAPDGTVYLTQEFIVR